MAHGVDAFLIHVLYCPYGFLTQSLHYLCATIYHQSVSSWTTLFSFMTKIDMGSFDVRTNLGACHTNEWGSIGTNKSAQLRVHLEGLKKLSLGIINPGSSDLNVNDLPHSC